MNTTSPRVFQLSLPIVFLFTFVVWLITRWPLMFPNDFPLNDGGMFAAMIEDLKRNGFRIPAYTTYNDANIPFAYPPLAFYIGAIVSTVFHVSAIKALCWIPFFFNLLSVLAFAAFAWTFWERKSMALFSALIFTLLPRTGDWLLSGGGLTRGVGFFWSMLAIHFLYRTFRDGQPRDAIIAGILAGLTFTSHLESGVFVFLSTFILSFQGRPWRERLLHIALIGSIAAIIVMPWVIYVVSQHGIQPYLSALDSGGRLRTLLIVFVAPVLLTEENTPVLMVLWWIGTFMALRQRKFLLPIWVLCIVLLMWRSPQTQSTPIIALLSGLALDALLRWTPRKLAHTTQAKSGPVSLDPSTQSRSLPQALLAPTVAIIAGVIFARMWLPPKRLILTRMDQQNHEAMRWVRQNTSPQTRFLILGTHRSPWYSDRDAEWFPVLANRRSIATVQGTEWLPNDAFKKSRVTSWRLDQAVDYASLQRVVAASKKSYDALYIDARQDAKLQRIQQEVEKREDYRKIRDGDIDIYIKTTFGS